MSPFYISFYLNKSNQRKDGRTPIYCSVIHNGKRNRFSTKLYLVSKEWNQNTQRVRSSNPNHTLYNTLLTKIRHDQEKAILESLFKPQQEKLKGKLIKVAIVEYLAHIKSLIDIDYSQRTYEKYSFMKQFLNDFMQHQYKSDRLTLKQLNIDFLEHVEEYCKLIKKYQNRTTHKALSRIRTFVNYCRRKKWMSENPFDGYRLPKYKKEIKFLTQQELNKLESTIITDNDRLEVIRKIFIFGCYTGLAYQELKNLKYGDMFTDAKGKEWFKIRRVKTQKDYIIPVLKKAKEMMTTLNTNGISVVPVPSNQKYNQSLKLLAKKVNIATKLTSHISRKTFATTVLLNSGIELHKVSALLGHANTSITQESYAQFDISKAQIDIE